MDDCRGVIEEEGHKMVAWSVGLTVAALEAFKQCLEGARGQRAVETLDDVAGNRALLLGDDGDATAAAAGVRVVAKGKPAAAAAKAKAKAKAVDLSEEGEEIEEDDSTDESDEEWNGLKGGKGKGKRARGKTGMRVNKISKKVRTGAK
jgi:hypothetical protein